MAESPRIERIEITLFTIEQPGVSTDRAGLGATYTPGRSTPQVRLAVRIYTDAGVTGEYIAPRGRAKVIAAACEALAFGLVGKPALERERHYLAMRRATKHVGEVGIGALDIALWDLAGKHHGASVAQLLGADRWRLPAYASTLHGDGHPDGLCSPEAYADFAERCLALGYPAYKMHGWHEGDPAREIAMLRAVASRVGDRMQVMYDSACNLRTLADAIRVGKVCDELGLYWFEDPYADGGISIHGHRTLKSHVRTPILITEFVRNAETTTDLVVAGATDFARVDPDYDGGITGSYKAAIAAQSLGIDTEVHSCGPPMRHLMAALRSSNYYEVNLVHPSCGNPWHLPVYADGYSDELDCVDADGHVLVPDGPGLGVTYDWDAVRRTTLETRIVE
ncbi:MAG: mandelate racemase/muconate lactonizing protein [Ectothiorhodospiraceae bacterium]|nr:mandelate racemase/muconate lactonizing protein [Chromatiales bacterium]MCP5156394.1 mandelate racemase/muconate lactonizing protein [Ectothiorhodospiraceae bacterium]